MAPRRPRVILDCNVLLQAILTPDGPGAACVSLVDAGHVTLVTSAVVLAEAREVLNRREIRLLKPTLTSAQVARFLEALAYRSDFVRNVPMVQHWARDPKDEPYLNLAIAGQADYLVTRDKDLLALATDHSAEAKQFRRSTRQRLRVVTPTDLLRDFPSP